MAHRDHGKKTIIDKTTGEIICACGCGRILTEKITDLDQLETPSNDKENRPRLRQTSAATLRLHDQGRHTLISNTGSDFAGRPLQRGSNVAGIKKMQQWIRAGTKKDQKLTYHLKTLALMQHRLQMSEQIYNDVTYMLHKLNSTGLRPGMSAQALVMACHYIASKKVGITLNWTHELEKMQDLDVRFKPQLIRRYVAEINEVLKVDILPNGGFLEEKRMIMNICAEAKLGQKVRDLALKFFEHWTKSPESCGKVPAVRAGVALFYAMDKLQPNESRKKIPRWKKEEIAFTLKVTQYAISGNLSRLQAWLLDHEKEILADG